MTIVIGIDPGINGGVVCLKQGRPFAFMPMPIKKIDGKRRIDVKTLSEFIKRQHPEHIIIEEPQLRPGEDINAHLTIGVNFGMILGVLESSGITYEAVHATTWTNKLHHLIANSKTWELGSAKEKSLAVFRKLYPAFVWTDVKVEHDGIIDALLIAFFWLWREGYLQKYQEKK